MLHPYDLSHSFSVLFKPELIFFFVYGQQFISILDTSLWSSTKTVTRISKNGSPRLTLTALCLHRLVLSLLSCTARTTAIIKAAMSLLTHIITFVCWSPGDMSVWNMCFSSPILSSPGALWNNFSLWQRGSPWFLHCSVSHLGVLHMEVPHLAPLPCPLLALC